MDRHNSVRGALTSVDINIAARFPTFLGEALGDGAVPWIWRNAATRVLAGIASGIGDTQTRRLITEYRSKQALVDFAEWTDAILASAQCTHGTNHPRRMATVLEKS